MNMDKKSHKFLTLVMYINYICSYIVIFMFNSELFIPYFILTVNLLISTISHYKNYTNKGVSEKAKTVLIIQMAIVFVFLYFDKSTYELLFLFLPIGDCIFSCSYRFSIKYTSISILCFYPYNILIHERTMGYPYSDVIARDIVIMIFVLIILYVSRVQMVEKMKYNKVLDERNRAYKELSIYADKIQEMAIHEERSRIAYMLHNSIGHMLVSISLSLQAEKMELIKNNVLKENDFSDVENQINEAISLLRKTIENSDDFIKMLGINELIEMFISNLQNNTSINIEYSIDEKINIPKRFNNIIYNVILESVTNSLKHSLCNNIIIKIKSINLIFINIEDDGNGFHEICYGFGITHLKEKIENLGGTYSIESNMGCKVSVVLPLVEI